MTSRYPSLLFSGGLDSTAMLLRAAREHRRVRTFYVKGGQVGEKALVELAARRLIIKAIEALTTCVIYDEIFDLQLDGSWHQTAQWLLVAASSRSICGDETSEVQIGYVKGDDAIGLLPTLQETWPGLSRLASGVRDFVPVPLRFPLAQASKEELYAELPFELRRLIWTCETPERQRLNVHAFSLPERLDEVFPQLFRPCGHCRPCQRFYEISQDPRYRDTDAESHRLKRELAEVVAEGPDARQAVMAEVNPVGSVPTEKESA